VHDAAVRFGDECDPSGERAKSEQHEEDNTRLAEPTELGSRDVGGAMRRERVSSHEVFLSWTGEAESVSDDATSGGEERGRKLEGECLRPVDAWPEPREP